MRKKVYTFETSILPSIRLTDTQKSVLTTIKSAPTPQVALENISTGRNMLAARDILKQLGLITFDDDSAEITNDGTETMKNANLIDDSGELTDEGRSFAQGAEANTQNPAGQDSTEMLEPNNQPESVPESLLTVINTNSKTVIVESESTPKTSSPLNVELINAIHFDMLDLINAD